jgi:hypothetical protein
MDVRGESSDGFVGCGIGFALQIATPICGLIEPGAEMV